VSPDTSFSLGQYYYLRQNYEKAIGYFEKAAATVEEKTASGDGYDMQAAYQLGVIYYDGLGVTPDAVSTTSGGSSSHLRESRGKH